MLLHGVKGLVVKAASQSTLSAVLTSLLILLMQQLKCTQEVLISCSASYFTISGRTKFTEQGYGRDAGTSLLRPPDPLRLESARHPLRSGAGRGSRSVPPLPPRSHGQDRCVEANVGFRPGNKRTTKNHIVSYDRIVQIPQTTQDSDEVPFAICMHNACNCHFHGQSTIAGAERGKNKHTI